MLTAEESCTTTPGPFLSVALTSPIPATTVAVEKPIDIKTFCVTCQLTKIVVVISYMNH